MPKLSNITPSEGTILLTIENDLLQEFIDKAIVSFRNRILSFADATGGQCHVANTLCLNTEQAIGS